ncbi:MAG: hypothetical protein HY433_00900 [Candidatus Liptonbacteria bacterium]|nr:hypothetical protein [Candidatus Liptonbacteria bacterium]
MEEKITDIEGLAGLIQRTMASKEDLQTLASKEDLSRLEEKMDDGFRGVNARLDLVREDISDLPAIRHELQDLRQRVERLEKQSV